MRKCTECGEKYAEIIEYYTKMVTWHFDEEDNSWNAGCEEISEEPTQFTCPNCGAEVPPPEPKGSW